MSKNIFFAGAPIQYRKEIRGCINLIVMIVGFMALIVLGGCDDCHTEHDSAAYKEIFVACMQSPNGKPYDCKYAALAGSDKVVCHKL